MRHGSETESQIHCDRNTLPQASTITVFQFAGAHHHCLSPAGSHATGRGPRVSAQWELQEAVHESSTHTWL